MTLLLATPTFALVDYYKLENNKVLQTCAYVSTADGPVQNWFKKNDAEIIIDFSKNENLKSKFNVYTLLMNGIDMNNVQIGLNPYYKVCDEIALAQGYCNHESDENHFKKMSLSALIDTHSFTYPIESFMLSTEGEPHVYKVETSGVYCAMLLSSDIPAKVDRFMAVVDWKQSYGHLFISDFIRMFTSIAFAFLYAGAASVLSFLIYTRLQGEKTSISLDPFKYKKFTLQYKFILFYWAYTVYFFAISLNYMILNKRGYDTSSLLVPITNLLYLASSTMITGWMIYHFLIFSAGAWFNGFKNSNTKLYVSRVIVAVLMLQMLIYDVETSNIYSLVGDGPIDFLSKCIYIEYIGVYFVCIVWSVLTSASIQDQKMKKIFFLTIGLLSFLFGMAILGTYIISSTAKSAAVTYAIQFVFAVIINALWYNVVIDNNQLVFLN